MMQFQNLYYDSFLKKYRDKKIIAYGIGGTFSDFLDAQNERHELIQAIDFLIDEDLVKEGMPVQIGHKSLKMQTPESFIGKDSMADKYVMILLLFLSSDFLCSFDQGRGVYALTENSIRIHHFDYSWFNEKEMEEL